MKISENVSEAAQMAVRHDRKHLHSSIISMLEVLNSFTKTHALEHIAVVHSQRLF